MGQWSGQGCALSRDLSTWSHHFRVDPAEVLFASAWPGGKVWAAGLGRKRGFHVSERFLSFHGSSPDLELKGGRLWEQELMGPVASRRPKLLPLPAEPGAPRAGEV